MLKKFFSVGLLSILISVNAFAIDYCATNPNLLDPVIFNVAYYKQMHPFLSFPTDADYQNNWCTFGANNGRRGSRFFASTDYKAMYSALTNLAPIDAINNYMNTGRQLGRAGSLLDPQVFDAETYRTQANRPVTDTYYQLVNHYLDWGIPRKTQSHPYFNLADYANHQAIENAGLTNKQIIGNYLTYGISLSRQGIANFPYAAHGLVGIGPEEAVFDSTIHPNGLTNRCQHEDWPDMSPRAFLTNTNKVQLLIGVWDMFTQTGSTLDSTVRKCTTGPALQSQKNRYYFNHRSHEWLEATYTRDGIKVAAISATDWHGNSKDQYGEYFSTEPTCWTGNGSQCWWGVLTSFVSNNGGVSYNPSTHPGGFLLAAPLGNADNNPNVGSRYGFFGISNIMKNPLDGKYYFFGAVSGLNPGSPAPGTQLSGTCLFRAEENADLENATSWKAWDGSSFTVDTASGQPCTRIVMPYGLRQGVVTPEGYMPRMDVRNVTYNTFLQKFVIVGGGWYLDNGQRKGIDIVYALSDSLTDWNNSPAHIALTADGLGQDESILYPTFIDESYSQLASALGDQGERKNFDITGSQPYLYFTYHKWGNYDHTMKRVPIRFSKPNSTGN